MSNPGWTGPTIPIEVQALILIRHYKNALQTLAATVQKLNLDVQHLLHDVEDGGAMVNKLADDPFLIRLLGKLQENEEKFGDSLMRKSDTEIFHEGREEIEDAVTYVAFALWVADGADLPDEVVEGGDEEE